MTVTMQAEFYRMISSNFLTFYYRDKNAISRALLNIYFRGNNFFIHVCDFFVNLSKPELYFAIFLQKKFALLLGLHMTTLPKPK